jgi:UDP-N-acetylmuramate dehydrogenase
LARYTSWRVGGPARCLYRPADLADLRHFLQSLDPGEPLLWLGLGSNLLVRDGGFRGTVIATAGRLVALDLQESARVRAEAGVSAAVLARFSVQAGLTGLEFLAGIPGTLGGALAMNAGAWGGETWTRVEQVETVDRHGQVRVHGPEAFEVGYRRVVGPPGEWFVAARFHLQSGDPECSRASIRELLDRRAASQPTGQPSCGSVFRNPPGDHAARLVDSLGLKGLRLGDAEVSPKHANFIINRGQARAADIEALIRLVQERVVQASGVQLQPEVQIVGEAA